MQQLSPSHVAGGMTHSSSTPGIFFQGDGQSQPVGKSHSNPSPVFGDGGLTHLNNVPNTGQSVGPRSLVMDANLGLSRGPHLKRNASMNMDSYMRVPTSPVSFSSNNSCSSLLAGSSILPQRSHRDLNSHKMQQSQNHGGASSATSLPTTSTQQISLQTGLGVTGSFIKEPNKVSQLQKKQRLDIKQEGDLQEPVLQQLLQRQGSMQLQNPNPQLHPLIEEQRLRQQQQQVLQSIPPAQRAHLLLLQQQQQLQLRKQLQQQGMPPVSPMKRPYDGGGVCSRRLMQYLYHKRQRPPNNPIAYWRKFVTEYYSPRAKKRWCLSLYDNVGHHSLGVFPQAAVDAWQCDVCGSKSGRGFEATFEVLPRLDEIKFGSGVTDELLFLDLPRERRFNSGIMMLEYGEAVQETVYEHLRVVREGQLRVIFTPDLKILSWEFCARRHEELLHRKMVLPQVNQLLQVAQKCQSTIAENGSDAVSQTDLQTNSNMVVAAGRQLGRSLELHSLNDLGFSKRYVRCLQIAEVVNSMKDLMNFCGDHKVGPIEALKSFSAAPAQGPG
ncbi:hypothetical protein LguiB_003619 [Lonicera macranthoides]